MSRASTPRPFRNWPRAPSTVGFLMLSWTLLHSPQATAAGPSASTSEVFSQAQIAFLKRDFLTSYRLANEIVLKSPQNYDARRIAAKSARELGRQQDCLRLMNPIPQKNILSDDVALVGDCGVDNQTPAWVVAFLQTHSAISENQDIANFWLGTIAYKKADYPKAEEFLKSISALPSRLEKDRAFMLERIRAVLSANRPPQARTPVVRSAAEDPDSTRWKPVKPTHDEAFEGWFAEPRIDTRVGLDLFRRSGIKIGFSDQKEFETKVDSDPEGAAQAVVDSTEIKNNASIEAQVKMQAGYRWAQSEGKLQSALGVRAFIAATVSPIENEYYDPTGESPRPNLNSRHASKGWGFYAGPFAEKAFGRYFSVDAGYLFRRVSPQYRGGVISHRLESNAHVDLGTFSASAGYEYEKLFTAKGVQSAYAMGSKADAHLARVGFFSFGAPAGFQLVRFTQIFPMASELVIPFVQNEGNFLEYNLTPRIHLSDIVSMLLWYRGIIGTERSYVAGSWAGKVAKVAADREKWELFAPSANYKSFLQEFRLQVDVTPHRNFTISSGGVYANLKNEFKSGIENSEKYAELLNRSYTRTQNYFLELNFQM